MVAFARVLAAGAALASAFLAGPAAALTLTFQIDVTGYNPDDPPIDDFQLTWTFDPFFYDSGGTPIYYGDVAGLIETPASATVLQRGGFESPLPPTVASGAEFRTVAGNTSVQFLQRMFQGDEVTERFSTYWHSIEFGGVVPAIAYTPGGFVHVIQTLGEGVWRQDSAQFIGGYSVGGPPQRQVDAANYSGTARLIAWDVEPENAAIPEPDAWALMILGFGLSGVALRRRRLGAAA